MLITSERPRPCPSPQQQRPPFPTRILAMVTKLFSALLRLPPTTRTCLNTLLTPITHQFSRSFSTTLPREATYNQVIRGIRTGQKARKPVSPQLARTKCPEMKGVCLRVGVTKPKKPNSGERKVARVRLSSGSVITAYIPGEGESISAR